MISCHWAEHHDCFLFIFFEELITHHACLLFDQDGFLWHNGSIEVLILNALGESRTMAKSTSSASVGSLSVEQKKALHTFFKGSPTSHTNATEEEFKAYIKKSSLEARHSRRSVLLDADSYLVATTNPATFEFIQRSNPKRLEALNEELLLSFDGLCDRYKSHLDEGRCQHLAEYFKEIEKCASLIRNITLIQERHQLEAQKEAEKNHDAGLKKWYKQKIALLEEFWARGFSAGKTVYLRQWMTDLNLWRLYWVWTGNLLRVTLGLLPDDFHNKSQAVAVTTNPQIILGYISWLLYYVRFLINFMLVLKHSIIFPGDFAPWMTDEEKRTVREKGRWNRFKEQLAIRKFTLINDLIWGITNFLCFFWLVGRNLGALGLELGTYGDILTVLLLVGDASLCMWARAEATIEHEKDIKVYTDEIRRLEESIADENREAVQAQIKRLWLAHDRCQFEWKYKYKKVTADMINGIGLIFCYATVVFPWVNLGLSAATMVMAGSIGLFVVSFIYSGYRAYVDVSQARDTRINALEECKHILTNGGEKSLSEVDYLRYNDLIAQAEYQAKLADYHLYTMMRSMIVQAIIPLAIFTAFTFATFGIAAAVCGAGVAIAIITHYILEFKKPENAELAKLDKAEYAKFDPSTEVAAVEKKIDETKKLGYFGLFSDKKEAKADIGATPLVQPPNLGQST